MIMKRIIIKIIRFYRKNISPRTSPKCRYIPTCSEYAIEAIERYGALKGGIMSLWRILKCNPFSTGGFDPLK